MGRSSDPFDRRATVICRTLYVFGVIAGMLVLGFSTRAWIIPIVAIGLYIPWNRVCMPRLDAWAERENQRAREERLRREAAERWIAELDRQLDNARTPQPPRIAFDAETQFAHGMSRYHTHLITPHHQRYLEEFYPDDEGNPSLKAGVYVMPIPVAGPERLDAPPAERPTFIPYDDVIEWPTWPKPQR